MSGAVGWQWWCGGARRALSALSSACARAGLAAAILLGSAVAVAGPPPRGVTTTFSADDAFSSSVVAAAAFAEGTKSDLLPFLSSHRTSAAEGAGRPRFPGDEGGVTATAHGSSGAQAAGPPFVGVLGAEGIFFPQIFSRAKEK